MIGSAIKNKFIEKYFELDDEGIYRFKATAKQNAVPGTNIKSDFIEINQNHLGFSSVSSSLSSSFPSASHPFVKRMLCVAVKDIT